MSHWKRPRKPRFVSREPTRPRTGGRSGLHRAEVPLPRISRAGWAILALALLTLNGLSITGLFLESERLAAATRPVEEPLARECQALWERERGHPLPWLEGGSLLFSPRKITVRYFYPPESDRSLSCDVIVRDGRLVIKGVTS